MEITSVRYRALRSHDYGYGNDAVEAEALVGPGETADEAMDSLKTWVLGQLDRVKERNDLVRSLQQLREDTVLLERSRDQTKREADEYRQIIRNSEKLYDLAVKEGLAEASLLDDLGSAVLMEHPQEPRP